MGNMKLKSGISGLFVLVFAGMCFVSCHQPLADYPRGAKMKRLSDREKSPYIFYWEADKNASKYTIYLNDDGFFFERELTDNYYIFEKSSYRNSESYAVLKTVDGKKSYLSDFLNPDYAEKPFTSIKAKASPQDSGIHTLSWEKLPSTAEYVIYGKFATAPSSSDLEVMFPVYFSTKSGFSTAGGYPEIYAEIYPSDDSDSVEKADFQINSGYHYAVYAYLKFGYSPGYYYLISSPALGSDLMSSLNP